MHLRSNEPSPTLDVIIKRVLLKSTVRSAFVIDRSVILKNLMHHVEDVRVSLLNFAKENHCVRSESNNSSPLTTLSVTNITRRWPNQLGDCVSHLSNSCCSKHAKIQRKWPNCCSMPGYIREKSWSYLTFSMHWRPLDHTQKTPFRFSFLAALVFSLFCSPLPCLSPSLSFFLSFPFCPSRLLSKPKKKLLWSPLLWPSALYRKIHTAEVALHPLPPVLFLHGENPPSKIRESPPSLRAITPSTCLLTFIFFQEKISLSSKESSHFLKRTTL